MLRRRAMSYELVFKALEFLAILKRGGGGGRGARKSVNRKLPRIRQHMLKQTRYVEEMSRQNTITEQKNKDWTRGI